MTTPLLRARWRNVDGKPVCAWCTSEAGEKPQNGISYGICASHKRKLIAEARADARKRPDQIAYSLTVLILAGAILVMFGLLAGAWLAVARWGWL